MSHRRLEARGLVHRYRHGESDALAECSLNVAPGARMALLGANGSGKTTLLLHLNGSLRPREGTVALDGEVQRHDRTRVAAWRRQVGLVVQDPDDMLLAGTVRQEVGFGPLNLGRSPDDAARDVDAILEELSLAHLADRPTHLLSGGERQRVAIAAVAAMRPCILVLDEPTSGLDPEGAAEVLDVLDRLHVAGTTIVMSTHDVDLAHGWADEVVVMGDGRVLAAGTPEVLHDDAVVAAARLATPSVVQLWRALPPAMRPATCPPTVAQLAARLESLGEVQG